MLVIADGIVLLHFIICFLEHCLLPQKGDSGSALSFYPGVVYWETSYQVEAVRGKNSCSDTRVWPEISGNGGVIPLSYSFNLIKVLWISSAACGVGGRNGNFPVKGIPVLVIFNQPHCGTRQKILQEGKEKKIQNAYDRHRRQLNSIVTSECPIPTL